MRTSAERRALGACVRLPAASWGCASARCGSRRCRRVWAAFRAACRLSEQHVPLRALRVQVSSGGGCEKRLSGCSAEPFLARLRPIAARRRSCYHHPAMPDMPCWTQDDVRGFLAHYGIPALVLEAAPLAGGCDNLNLLVTLGARRMVLRRYSHTTEDEIEWELQLIRHLGSRGYPTPAVLAGEDGALFHSFLGRPAALFTFVPGRESSPQSAQDCAQVAAAVAELHLITRDLHLPHARSHTDSKRLERLAATASRVASPGLAEMAAQAIAFRGHFTGRLAEVNGDLPSGVVHHDANPGNALLDEEGKVVAIIDFDEAHEGELVTDVASLLRLWATPRDWQGLRAEMTEAVLAAYNRHRPLSLAEWEMLPDFFLLFTLADAAEYVSRSLASDPTGTPVHECLAYQRFIDLQRDRTWMRMLRPRL